MPLVLPKIGPALPQGGTRVGNGSAVLEGIDGRTLGARRYKELVTELDVQTTQLKRISTSVEKLLIRRIALLALWCEKIEGDAAAGRDYDIASYTSAANSMRKMLSDLGLLGD